MPDRLTDERIAKLARIAKRGGFSPFDLKIVAAALPALLAERETLIRERDLAIAHDRQPYPTTAAYEAVCEAFDKTKAERERLRETLRLNVGDAYGLLTQGESPTQLRQPAAQRIYDRSKAALAEGAPDG